MERKFAEPVQLFFWGVLLVFGNAIGLSGSKDWSYKFFLEKGMNSGTVDKRESCLNQ